MALPGGVVFPSFSLCNLVFGSRMSFLSVSLIQQNRRCVTVKPLLVRAKANTRTESAKVRNRRMRLKFNGTPSRPRLSVFCSDKQLYAMLVDDHNKKCLFYGSTLQRSICDNPHCTRAEAAERVGEELVKACMKLNINEFSSYDLNGFTRGDRIQAFETVIDRHGLVSH